MITLKSFVFLPLFFCCASVFAQQYTTMKGVATVTYTSYRSSATQTVILKFNDKGDCFFTPDDTRDNAVHIRLTKHETQDRDGIGNWDTYVSDSFFDAGYGQYTFKICTVNNYRAFVVQDTEKGITYTVYCLTHFEAAYSYSINAVRLQR